MKGEQEIEKNASTEEKIKEAARRVFTKKGYAATRTRDIAEESGYNLALINYYFRSKEKLFDIIMVEHLQLFVHSVVDIVNDPATTLEQKLEVLISHYIDMLVKNPDLPLFVLSAVNADPQQFVDKLGVEKAAGGKVYIMKQWQEYMAARGGLAFNPMHVFLNMLSLTIFPFVGSPMIRNRTGIDQAQFNELMQERKMLIPLWIKAMLQVKAD